MERTKIRLYSPQLLRHLAAQFCGLLALSASAIATPAPVIPTGHIDCTDGTANPCSADFSILSSRQGQGYTAVDLGHNTSNVAVSVTTQQKPRSLRLSLLNGPFPDAQTTPGYSLNADLSSSTVTSNSGDFILLGDNFSSINVKLDGYGQAGQSLSGLNASQICAQKIKASTYGSDTLSNFTNLRLNNSSLPQNACVVDDINFMQSSKFACDPGYSEIVTINSIYTVPVLQIPKIPRCQTSLSYDVCVRRKMQVSCNWTVYRNDGTNSDGSINYTTMPYGTTVTRTMPENQYFYLRGIMTDADLCNLHVAQEISDTTYVPQGVTSNFTADANPGTSILTNAYTFQGDTVLGSTTITFSSVLPTDLSVGQSVVGNGIPANTTVLQINSGTVIISQAATVTDTSVNFLTGLAVGQTVLLSAGGTNLVPAGTTITGVSPSLINLSKSLTGGSSALGATFQSFSQQNIVNPLTDNANNKAGCSTSNPCSWKQSGLSATLSTPGIDPAVGDQLLPGSNWDLANTNLNEHCSASNDPQTGFWSTIKTVTTNYVAYDPVDASCKQTDIVTYNAGSKIIQYPALSIDPRMTATWFYTGMAQEPDFGTQPLQCDLGNCPVNSVTSDLSQILDSITPGNGQSATQQGAGLVLIYDTQSLSVESKVGSAGAGGQNDIINSTAKKVCVKVHDASTDGLTSPYARDPLVLFNRYNWTAIQTTISGSPGQQPPANGNAVVVWKKLDSSVRYYLQDKLFSQ
jgi:hypothetical protein